MTLAKSKIAEPVHRQWYVRAGISAALMGALIVWYVLRPNPQVARVRELQKELFKKSPETLSPEERKEKFETLRAEREKLTSEERKDLRKETAQQFQMKASAEAVAYLKMTPAERLKFIDEKIAREQTMLKKWGTAKGPANGGGPAPGQAVLAANSGGLPPAVSQPAPPGKGPSTPEERDARRRESLLHVPPEARAGFDQIRLDMAVRRAQLGLPAPQGRGPR